jgi:hypothetical protein
MTDSGSFSPLGGISITGAADIERASLIALRGALKLETKGLKRHGRSARTIANERMGTDIKTAVKTYKAFDAWLVKNYGLEPRPLGQPQRKE